jgi:hypothetical protein
MPLRSHNQTFGGRRILGTPYLGTAASLVPSTGTNGPGYLYPLIALLSIGPSEQLWGLVGGIPAGLTLAANEPSDFVASGADGFYSIPFTLYRNGVQYGATDGYYFTASIGSTGITGTAARTQAPNVSTAAGSVTTPITGTLARTQAKNASAAVGAALFGIIGGLTRTQAPNVSTASGHALSPITGTVAVTQRPNVAYGLYFVPAAADDSVHLQITVALNGSKRRDLVLPAGQRTTIDVTVYAVDGEATYANVQNARILTETARSRYPVGTAFAVGPDYERVKYRLAGELFGVTITLATGYIVVAAR